MLSNTSGAPDVAATTISPVPEIVAELRAGRIVVVVDDEDRENEGDLLMAAEFVTPEAINFMAKFGRGLVCLTLTGTRCDQLGLPPMARNNGTVYGTAFTVSIEAAEGVTTGISAADRARTVQAAVARNAKASDLVQPGHIFPLRAQEGGVLMRAGHTEAGCDLAALAGCEPAAVICEILKDDGTMARLPDLIGFAREHGLKIGTIADLIQYRAQNESLIQRMGERVARTPWGEFRAVAYRDRPSGQAHIALVRGDVRPEVETLVRVHEPLSVLDWLDTDATTHSWPLPRALEAIGRAEAGVAVLLNAGEAANQFFDHFDAIKAIDGGAKAQPPKVDLRTYGVGAQILRDVGVGRMKLLSRPRKMPSMGGYELKISGYEEER